MDGDGRISRNCRDFLARLQEVAGRYNRNPAEITVVAVSKTRPYEEILAAVAAGMSHIGESKVQEAQAKFTGKTRSFSLHMIGHLQSNKVKQAVELFDMIESVDSLKLARAIASEAERANKVVPILLEVNCSREPQKFGLTPDETPDVAGAIFEMNALQLRGLMTVAPFVEDESAIRESFVELRKLGELIRSQHPRVSSFNQLSMGMTDDWEFALAEGSTMIRIGRALFGERS